MPRLSFQYFSDTLGKASTAEIILPSTTVEPPYSVLFLLHGLSDDQSAWTRYTSIERYVSDLPLIVVMPDGGRGFYCDAQEGFAYATAIGTELVELVQRHFKTQLPWSIAGLSMGGYGALKLALLRPDIFSSVTSLSGALDFGHQPPLDRDPDAHEWIRIFGSNPAGGPNDLRARLLDLPTERRPVLRIDCGTEDFLIEMNRGFHQFLLEEGIEHEYEEHPGEHNWAYWDRQIQPALDFHMKNI